MKSSPTDVQIQDSAGYSRKIFKQERIHAAGATPRALAVEMMKEFVL
jgi:hypothetical protein